MTGRISIFLFQLALSTLFLSFALYSYLREQNRYTELKMALPKMAGEIQELEQSMQRLKYRVISFENPAHLLQLADSGEYAHLKFPVMGEVVRVQEGFAVSVGDVEKHEVGRSGALVAAK